MLRGQLRFSLLVAALLGGLVASARAQVSLTLPPAGDATTSSPADPSTVPVPPPIAGSPSSTVPAPLASVAAPPSGGDSVLPTEPLVKITDAAMMAHCEYLGQESRSSEIAGAPGRAQIRAELGKAAADRGASHLRFSDYQDGSTQSEVARLYGCRDPRIAEEPKSDGDGSSSRLPRGALAIFAELLPAPSLSTNVTGTSQQINGVTAYGLSANLDYFASPHTSIGFAPRYTMGLQGEGAIASATQLDLLARISIGTRAGDGASVRVYGTVGASWIFLPLSVTSSGVAYGLGGVVSLPVGDSGFFSVDIGYQFGAQTVRDGTQDVDVATNFLHVGIGLGTFL